MSGESTGKGKGLAEQKAFWDDFYARYEAFNFYDTDDLSVFYSQFEKRVLQPPHLGGDNDRDFAYATMFQLLIQWMAERRSKGKEMTILDVGSGFGDHTVYIASKNQDARIIGLDISPSAKRIGESLAKKMDVRNCEFLCESISRTSLQNNSIDSVVGFGSFHHFIIEKEVACEIRRIIKKDGRGFFVDSFHENPLFRVFHNRELMEKMGDQLMKREIIKRFWGEDFEVEIIPMDWMVMIDKLIYYIGEHLFGKTNLTGIQIRLSRLFFLMDRRIARLPRRFTTCSAGSIITVIKPRTSG